MDKKQVGNLLFVGCMMIGTGMGFLFHNIPAGALIGLGVGFGFKALPMLMQRDEHLANEKHPDDEL